MKKLFLHIIFFITALFSVIGEVYAQDIPLSGQEIINQAAGTYIEEGDTSKVDFLSNEVKVIVDNTTEFSFFPNNSIKNFRGQNVEFTHFVRNSGTTSANIDIKGYNAGGDDFDLQDIGWTGHRIFKANNFANSDTITTTAFLQPGEELEIKYQGWISTQEERAKITSIMIFEATSRETGITIQNADTISILIGAEVDIIKNQIGAVDLTQGDAFQYRIQGRNIGDLTAIARDFTLDGNPGEKVILRDSIPANLTFVSFESLEKGTPYYHVIGAGEYEFLSIVPEDLTTVDIIGVGFDSLQVGETFDVTFNVTINENASGRIQNVAEVSFVDPEGTVTTAAASNEVVTELPTFNATINYFTSSTFEEETATSSIGEVLNIQATATACNEKRSEIELVIININSTLTSDKETYTAVETAENTGIFRILEEVPTRDGFIFPVEIDNKILETAEDDIIVAELNCNGLDGGGGTSASIEAEVLVDPFGIVFDSETNEVIPNAEVVIIDVTGANNGGNPGQPATVYSANGVDLATNTYISETVGKYKFPFLRPGTYRLEVTPPKGYEFSSKIPFDSLPDGRKVDQLASFGQEFEILNQATGIDFDIPLDPLALGVLFAEKKVDRSVAEIGDFVNYTITVKSQAVNTVENMTVYDELPFAFEYQIGSAKVDGVQLLDPIGGVGPDLAFSIGNIEPGGTKTLTYRVYLGPGADRSDGINVALIQSDELIVKTSNEAKVKIEVSGGVFNDEALIIGKVFLDCDENNMQNGAELGIPGVRLYLENGNYVITDSKGMYSFYAIKPNKHVLKLDNYSLPEGSKMKVLDNRHAFDPSSRFVDVKKGELHRADFAVCECSEDVINEIYERADVLNESSKNSLSNSLSQNFSIQNNNSTVRGGNSVQASGTVGNMKAIELENKATKAADSTKAIVQKDSVKALSIEELIVNADPSIGFLNIADGDTVTSSKLTIWAKGTSDAMFDLFLNDELVGSNRIGQRSVFQEKRIQVWEYVSIELESGINTLEIVEADPFGNVRGSKKINVLVPGKLNKVLVTVPRNNVAADGTSTALINIKLIDKDGIKIGSRMPMMLDVSAGTWLVEDLDSKTPGTQIFIENGEIEMELKSTIEPTTSTIRASVGDISGDAKVEFLPDLRPLIAAGIIEGTLRLRDPLNIASAVDNDGFERELKDLSYNINSFTADARFAFFLKGKVSGKTLLTAGFDSEKEENERLFRDIRPEEFYPVYGESSIKGFDAQSSGRMYIRLDRGKTYALYGDFITQENRAEIQLSGYSRSQNGIKTHFEQGAVAVEAFGVSSISSRRIREFQGQGISRYELPDNDLISNSEIIELITYEREQTNVIKSIERLTRFTDYVVDPFSGVITFRNPVFSVDSNFNPVFIRATYEVENDSERYMIGGVNGNIEVINGLKIGAGIIKDNNPNDEFTMASTNLNFQLSKSTAFIAEAARTTTIDNGTGNAGRIELQHKGTKYDLNGQLGRSDANFDNQGASLGQSRTEARARGRYNFTSKTNINAEFLISRNDTTGDQTLGSLVNVQHAVGSGINAELGVRYSEQTSSTAEDVINTNLRSKITATIPYIKGASTFGEYEQDLNEADRKTIAIGGDYKIKSIAKAYARHEFISSAGGRYTLQSNAQRNNTVFGLDASYMKNGKVFSEYRMNDALDGRTGQASLGLRNRFDLTEGLALNAGFERIFTVQGPNSNDGTALSSAIEYTGSDNWKGSARAEARFGTNSNTYLNTIGYGLKLNTDWTFLGRNIVALSTKNGVSGINKLQQRLQIGAAYRNSETNKYDALFRYEFKFEKDLNIAPDFFRTAHVVSSHGNYHPNSDLVFSGRLAAKYAIESDDQLKSESFLELVSGRVTYDLNERWDTGINASLLANSTFTTKDYGLGIELGYLVATNLRLATGFNFFGYEDQDLAVNNYTQPGVYLGFSYKFDEQVFKSLAPERSKNFIDESLYLTCIPCEAPMDIKSMPIDIPDHVLEPVALKAAVIDYKPLTRYVLLPRQIHFDNDKSYINPSTAQMLDKVAKFLMSEDDYTINLSGFTDLKSSVEYNQALSDRRSMAARAYLVSAGVEDRKLIIDGYGELQSTGENIVEMALERKVELDLNELNSKVKFVDQVEDLQVQQKKAGIGKWDYIFKTEHNAVPTNLNLASGSTSLSLLNKYLIQRIAIALARYPSVNVSISLPGDLRFEDLQNQILNELAANDADISRFMFKRGTTGDNETVRFDYSNAEHLDFYSQNDDIKFRNNKAVPALVESIIKILNSREDYELIHDLSQSYVVPDRVNFKPNSSVLDNETQAVLSRIGSYLRNNSSVYLELIGDGSKIEEHRMKAMLNYLVEWGIEATRITTSRSTINTSGKSIRIEYRNADSINLRNIEFLNKGRGQ